MDRRGDATSSLRRVGGLGRLRSVHGPAESTGSAVGKATALLALAAVPIAAVALTGTRGADLVVVTGVVLGVALAAALLFLWADLRRARSTRAVGLYDRGFAVADDEPGGTRGSATGRTVRTVAFDDVDALSSRRVFATGSTPAVTHVVRTRDGREVLLTSDTARLEEIVASLVAAVTPRILQAARTALAAGRTVPFGPLVLDADALRVSGHRVTWPELARVAVTTHHVTVATHHGRTHSEWFFAVRNVTALVALLTDAAAPGVVSVDDAVRALLGATPPAGPPLPSGG